MYICMTEIIRKKEDMKAIQLSPAQLTLLESFARIQSQEEADELSRVIRDYYARKLDEELEKLWEDGTLNQQKLDELSRQHLRTPYKE